VASEGVVSQVSRERRRHALAIGFLACLTAASCGRQNALPVRSVVPPEYPLEARVNNLQGTVQVNICVGADGKVVEANRGGRRCGTYASRRR
jgi:outer membrane biosynthesis protein TonB